MMITMQHRLHVVFIVTSQRSFRNNETWVLFSRSHMSAFPVFKCSVFTLKPNTGLLKASSNYGLTFTLNTLCLLWITYLLTAEVTYICFSSSSCQQTQLFHTVHWTDGEGEHELSWYFVADAYRHLLACLDLKEELFRRVAWVSLWLTCVSYLPSFELRVTCFILYVFM